MHPCPFQRYGISQTQEFISWWLFLLLHLVQTFRPLWNFLAHKKQDCYTYFKSFSSTGTQVKHLIDSRPKFHGITDVHNYHEAITRIHAKHDRFLDTCGFFVQSLEDNNSTGIYSLQFFNSQDMTRAPTLSVHFMILHRI